MKDLSEILDSVSSICRKTGVYLLEAMHHASVEMKGSDDLVTTADLEAERLIIASLKDLCPEASFLSEEKGRSDENHSTDLLWVIDPLDGTVNYAFQIPFFSISIALLKNRQPILGVVYAPALDELYEAKSGEGAHLNKKKLDLRVNSQKKLNMIATSAGMTESDFKNSSTHYHAKLLAHYDRLRLMGSQALHLCFVASGRLEAALTNKAKLWDDAAGALILTEAHGIYTDFSGDTIFPLPENSSLYDGKSYESLGANSQQSLDKIIGLISCE